MFLARALAAVQIPLATSATVASGVGGACFGARVSRDGLKTNSDVAYVFYDHARVPEIHMTRIVAAGWRSGVQYSQAFVRDATTGIFSPQMVVFESDEHFTDLNDRVNAAKSLERTYPAPRYATLVDKATSTTAFVPLEDAADLMRLTIGEQQAECAVRGYLLAWIDQMIRSAPAGAFGLLCVTKDLPPRPKE
jgi:hypothetical protein